MQTHEEISTTGRTWTTERRALARRVGRRLIVVANRAPFHHVSNADGRVSRVHSSGGLVTAIEPLLLASGGTWIAHGDANDVTVADARCRVEVRAGRSSYQVRFVGVADQEYGAFYGGFSNEALWPLCHATAVSPVFRAADFAAYHRVNRRFAVAVREEASGSAPIVFVQDYHFALAPRSIRRLVPSATIVSFWHIPWPHARLFRGCPWGTPLLNGLLGSDIVGLQTDEDCDRFLDAVALLTPWRVARSERLVLQGTRVTRVRAYPVGVPRPRNTAASESDAAMTPADRARVLAAYDIEPDTRLLLGVDRMDYTKGLPQKLLAVEHLLERRPDLRGRVVLLQIAEPSRQTLEAYRAERDVAVDIRRRVNARFGSPGRDPIVLVERHAAADEIARLYRAADVCYVNSLHDGMNLVAKEFVAARHDGRGVLVLSDRAGASKQLKDAILVNPHSVERGSRALEQALEMGDDEQQIRMAALRRIVFATDNTWWTSRILEDAIRYGRTTLQTLAVNSLRSKNICFPAASHWG